MPPKRKFGRLTFHSFFNHRISPSLLQGSFVVVLTHPHRGIWGSRDSAKLSSWTVPQQAQRQTEFAVTSLYFSSSWGPPSSFFRSAYYILACVAPSYWFSSFLLIFSLMFNTKHWSHKQRQDVLFEEQVSFLAAWRALCSMMGERRRHGTSLSTAMCLESQWLHQSFYYYLLFLETSLYYFGRL